MNAKTLDEEQYMSTTIYEHNFLLIIIFISTTPCLLSWTGTGVLEWTSPHVWTLTVHRPHQEGCAGPVLHTTGSYKEINEPLHWQWLLPPPIIITTCYQPLHGKKNVLEPEWLNKCNKMKQLSSRDTNSRSSWFPAAHTQSSWDSVASLCLQSCITASEGLREKDGSEVEKRERKGEREREGERDGEAEGEKGKPEYLYWFIFHQYNKTRFLFRLCEKDKPEGSYDMVCDWIRV